MDNLNPPFVYKESNEEQRPEQAVSPPEERRRQNTEDYFYPLKDGIGEKDNTLSSPQLYGHPQPDKNHNELSLLTQPLHSSSSYGSTREEQPLIEDHQHDRPEPTPEKEAEKLPPSDYTRQILSEPQPLQKEQRYPPVYDTHYAPEPYEYQTVASVYDEKGEEYNIPFLPKGVTPLYGFTTPIHVPELSFPNRRLRFEYISRPQAQHPQEL